MSQDIVADTLNQVMNAKRAGHESVTTQRHSKFLMSVLALAKLRGYIEEYRTEGRTLTIKLGKKLNACKAIKPRFVVTAGEIMKYARRYLPARDMGVIIVSTSQGLMAHHAAIEKNIGGSLIAYLY